MPDNMKTTIIFTTRNFTNLEKKYFQLNKKALAIIFPVKKRFQYFMVNDLLYLHSCLYFFYRRVFLYFQQLECNDMHYIYIYFNMTSDIIKPLKTEMSISEINSIYIIHESELFKINQFLLCM